MVRYWRQRWAEILNNFFITNSINSRVDHRSLRDQGIDREATQHLGRKVVAMERRGVKTNFGNQIREIKLMKETNGNAFQMSLIDDFEDN